ncbi:MAG TPA: hypothetical protein VF411_07500 [Bacteroidia bacterium]
MKNYIIACIAVALLTSCSNNSKQVTTLQHQVNELQKLVDDTYKPGFGETMSRIQMQHAKLWFAGQNQNWKLADFEIKELMESLADIQKYQTERKESEKLSMLNAAIDSVSNAIQQKNPLLFKSSFVLLTNTCNNCHRATNFEFNVVKTPETSPFSNQDFKPKNK